MRFSKITLALSILFLTGCSQGLEKISVRDQWAQTIRNFSLIPIYPMREGVFIGDIFITGGSTSNTLGYRYFDNQPLGTNAEKKERQRPTLPATLNFSSQNSVSTNQPTGSIYQPINTSKKVNRARLAALPGISAVHINGGEIGGQATAGGMGVLLGAGSNKNESLSININAIEMIEIPDVLAWKEWVNYCKYIDRGALEASIKRLPHDKGKENLPYQIHMVTRVFYSRQIEYIYSNSEAQTGAIGIGNTDAVPDLPIPTTETNSKPNGDSKEDTTAIVNQALLRVAENVKNTTPGVSARLYSQNGNTQSLSETFERPLAFGVEVLSVNVNDILNNESNTGCTKSVSSKIDNNTGVLSRQ